jgi:apolipoprotein N-acyltransferase
MFLFDVAPVGAIGALVAVAFFFIALASGVFAFIMLRKTIKMAFRMVIVAAVLLIAVFGSIALWWFLQPSRPANRPTRPTPSINQTR